MEFTDQEMMCLFDAVMLYSAQRAFDGCPTVEAFHESIMLKIQHVLEDRGYRFDGHVEYSVATR